MKIYANPKFDCDQMDLIRCGFSHQLDMEEIKLFANSKYNFSQMFQICLGFMNKLSMDQVLTYADPLYNFDQMGDMRIELEKGMTIAEVKEKYKPDQQDSEHSLHTP